MAATLVKHDKIPVFAIKGEDHKTYYKHIHQSLGHAPHITMDDGADLVTILHTKRQELLKHIIGGTEETTTGVIRLKSMAKQRRPALSRSSPSTTPRPSTSSTTATGPGQSTLDGILRATNVLLAGSNFVVAGYGWCGRGLAMRAQGAGARVIVTEVNPLKAIEAVMDGYDVLPMAEAAKIGDVFVTVTGNKSVIAGQHFKAMKDGAIVANSGHFNVEIDIPALDGMAKSRSVRSATSSRNTPCPTAARSILLGEGRLINLAAAEGHPAMVMDMSFANQALSVLHLVKNAAKLDKTVYSGPQGDRRGDRPAQAGHDGRPDRQADAGAEEIPGRLAGRDLRPRSPGV